MVGQRLTRLLLGLTALALIGCQLLSPAVKPPGLGTDEATRGPTAAPATAPEPAGEVKIPELPPLRGTLSGTTLGYLTGNVGAALKGSASVPEALTGNVGAALTGNVGAALTGNVGAALTGNVGAALTGNVGAALAGNAGATYRVSAKNVAIAGGFVYLTAPDERFYVDEGQRLFGTVTDAEGRFELNRPATDSVIANVLLAGNRRLSAVILPGEAEIKVDLASTLATEFLRAKSAEHRFTFAQALAGQEARTSLKRILDLTAALFESDDVLGAIKPDDLTLSNLPLLRQRYVAAFGTSADRRLSDEWVQFLKTVKGEAGAADAKYRSLAVTDLRAGVPTGHAVLSAAAVGTESVYLFSYSRSSAEIRLIPASGDPRVLLRRARSSASSPNALTYVKGMVATRDGKLVLADAFRQFVALFDPGSPEAGSAFDIDDPDSWGNPGFLLDTFGIAPEDLADGIAPDDVVLDDAEKPGLYLLDSVSSTLWHVPDALAAPGDPLPGPFAGVAFEIPGQGDQVPASALDDLRLNQPSGIAFHRRASDGVPFLYVTDTGTHAVFEINLASRTVRRVAGAVPPYKEGLRDAGCYAATEEGGDPLAAHLRFPGKLLFDDRERLIIADSDNNLVRIVDVYAADPRIWTIAGVVQDDDDTCGGPQGRLQPAAFVDGEARRVAIGTPQGMALDGNGDLILGDDDSNRARKLWLSRLR